MNELPSFGAFLRSRRERLTPAEVGLPGGRRRRTPGLRREELAMLADISIDYLVRLEQNRDGRPSYPVVIALANALRLDDEERAHLLRLATPGATELAYSATSRVEPLRPTTLALLEQLATTPAVVVERSVDLSAWNRAFDVLLRPTGLFDMERPNLARYVFLSPHARTVHRNWEREAREYVARLRASSALDVGDDALDAVIRELLRESAEFAALWASHDVLGTRPGLTELRHPDLGEIQFDVEALLVPSALERRLLVYVPSDDATRRSVEELLARSESANAHGVLRAV